MVSPRRQGDTMVRVYTTGDRVLASPSGLQRVRVWLKHRGQDKGLTLALEGQ